MVQLGRIKGIKGRLVTRIFRFPRLVPCTRNEGETRGRKKDGGKFAPYPPRSRSPLVPLLFSSPSPSRPIGFPLWRSERLH